MQTSAENTKYEFVQGCTIKHEGKLLTRIRALRDIEGVCKKGDLGGYLESEKNLAYEGNSWVSNNARVYGDAYVSDNAYVTGSARVTGSACVSDNAYVTGSARVTGSACVSDNACVTGSARVTGSACVSDNAYVYGSACVSDNAYVYGSARVYGDAHVSGSACVYGDAHVSGSACVSSQDTIFWTSNVGTENGTLTAYLTKDNNLQVIRGCFIGSVDEFLAASKEKHDDRVHNEYQLLIQVARSRIEHSFKEIKKNQ